jgi:hypothetical protein
MKRTKCGDCMLTMVPGVMALMTFSVERWASGELIAIDLFMVYHCYGEKRILFFSTFS